MFKRTATDLAIQWIGTVSVLALFFSVLSIVLNAFTIKDPEVYKGCFIVAAIASTGISGLIGYIGGANSKQHIPSPPTGEIK